MGDRKQSNGHSYPVQKTGLCSQQDWECASFANLQSALMDSMNTPSYQALRNNTARTWAPDRQNFSNPTIHLDAMHREQRDGCGVQSPSSDTTVKAEESRYEYGQGSQTRSGVIPVALHPSAADTVVPLAMRQHYSQAQARPQGTMYNMPSPWNQTSPWNQIPPATDMGSHSRVSSGAGSPATVMTDYSQTRSVGSPDSDGCMSNGRRVPSHYSLFKNFANTVGSPQDLHVPGQTDHLGRAPSRMSSMPTMPSPLGPRRTGEHLVSGTPGLVSQVPEPLPHSRKLQYEAQKSPMSDLQSAHPSPYGGKSQQEKPQSMQSPHMYGLHARQPTDPFVDYTDKSDKSDKSAALRPRDAQSSNSFTLPFQSAARTPTIATVPRVPQFSPALAKDGFPPTPTFSSFPPRPDLPITPPPLARYNHKPEARARLEAQKSTREEWIRKSAAEIANLAKLRHAAELQYHSTKATADYRAWQELEGKFADATDLGKKQEERRGLLLGSKGMEALKTDKVEDRSAAYVGAVGEERLLGFKMALMERVCAEVKKEETDVEISAEMLATLSLEEKSALRAHLVARLDRSRRS